MNADTQVANILNHLQTKGSITPMEALNQYGCFRLASRICDLKKKGEAIKTTMVEEVKVERHGFFNRKVSSKTIRYAKYSLA